MTYSDATHSHYIKQSSSMHANDENLLQGFPPVINQATHTLILGSFPGGASLQAQEYYAFPQNQFWRLLTAVLDEDLTALNYPQRLERLLAHGIGLWDVFDRCQRQGSLDSAIKQASMNNFEPVQLQYPQLKRLCFNGKTAAAMQARLEQLGYQTLCLPSSSPAYAQLSFSGKLLQWQLIKT